MAMCSSPLLQPVTATLLERIRILTVCVSPTAASALASQTSPEGSVTLASSELTDFIISPPLSALVRGIGQSILLCVSSPLKGLIWLHTHIHTHIHVYIRTHQAIKFDELSLFFLACDCSVNGSVDDFCNQFNGQCTCRPNISGRDCSSCDDGFYSFDASLACQACGCDLNGSMHQICDKETGQCPCIQNVSGEKCSECQINHFDFPNCL